MSTKTGAARLIAGTLGSLIILSGATAAIADEVQNNDVDVKVDIAPHTSGALTLSVAPGDATLSEVTSTDATVREFTGTLPTVTVTDDRANVPANVAWYVTGQASGLTESGGGKIEPGNLGWTPNLLANQGDGEVAEGPKVDTVLDAGPNNVGLKDAEFLALSLSSGEAATVGSWKANAGLTLKTPANVAPGSYSGKITLTLWEDAL